MPFKHPLLVPVVVTTFFIRPGEAKIFDRLDFNGFENVQEDAPLPAGFDAIRVGLDCPPATGEADRFFDGWAWYVDLITWTVEPTDGGLAQVSSKPRGLVEFWTDENRTLRFRLSGGTKNDWPSASVSASAAPQPRGEAGVRLRVPRAQLRAIVVSGEAAPAEVQVLPGFRALSAMSIEGRGSTLYAMIGSSSHVDAVELSIKGESNAVFLESAGADVELAFSARRSNVTTIGAEVSGFVSGDDNFLQVDGEIDELELLGRGNVIHSSHGCDNVEGLGGSDSGTGHQPNKCHELFSGMTVSKQSTTSTGNVLLTCSGNDVGLESEGESSSAPILSLAQPIFGFIFLMGVSFYRFWVNVCM